MARYFLQETSMTRHMAQTHGKRCMVLTYTSLKKLKPSDTTPLPSSQLTEAQGHNGPSTGRHGTHGTLETYTLTGGEMSADDMMK